MPIFLILSLITTYLLLTVADDNIEFFSAPKTWNHAILGNISIILIMRSFNGHGKKFKNFLRPSLMKFVDRDNFPLVALLDEESTADHHIFGEELTEMGYAVLYEPHPAPGLLDYRPQGNGGKNSDPHYISEGYYRQLYSTFFFDLYTDADIIGIVDADIAFNTFLTIESVLDETGKIKRAALHGNHFQTDSLMLKEDVNYNFMSTEIMPQFFFRSTFTKVREVILKNFNATSFDEAWKQFAATNIFSPANILSFYGVTHEPTMYRLFLPGDEQGMITVANNRPGDVDDQFAAWRTACCRMYGEEGRSCRDNWRDDVGHAVNVEGVGYYKYLRIAENGNLAWKDLNALVDEHYEHVKKALEDMDPVKREQMKDACH